MPTAKQVWGAYQECFSASAGQTVLEDMKQACHIYSTMVGDGPIDPYKLAFLEGERNAILRIMAILESKEGQYVC